MKEAIVAAGPKVTIQETPIPTPNDDQLVIKVHTSGSNPKDWKIAEWMNKTLNAGDDIAGTVHTVGKNVSEFKPGDRVFAFHEMMTPGGSYAEYAVAYQHTTAHLPAATTFEEGATVPLAALTAAVGLFRHLALPQPWTPAPTPSPTGPLVIYGAASAVGVFAVQLAARANIHPLICIAGDSQDHVKTFIDASKGDVVLDYRKGDDAVVQGIKDAAGGKEVLFAYDAVSEHNSDVNLGKALSAGGVFTTVLPTKSEEAPPEGIRVLRTMVGSVHAEDADLGYVFMRYFAKGLREGWFRGQRVEVVPGGLGGVQTGLENLKAGKAKGVKYVFRIEETA